MTHTHGKIWWSELMTRDLAAAKAYYGGICGWTFDGMDMGEGGTYWIAMNNGKPAAGILDMSGMAQLADVPAHWVTYIAVDDVDATVAATRKAGGKILKEAFDVPNTGRIAIVADPGGAAVGIMTPAPMPPS